MSAVNAANAFIASMPYPMNAQSSGGIMATSVSPQAMILGARCTALAAQVTLHRIQAMNRESEYENALMAAHRLSQELNQVFELSTADVHACLPVISCITC